MIVRMKHTQTGKKGKFEGSRWDGRHHRTMDCDRTRWARQKHQQHQNLMNGQSSVSLVMKQIAFFALQNPEPTIKYLLLCSILPHLQLYTPPNSIVRRETNLKNSV